MGFTFIYEYSKMTSMVLREKLNELFAELQAVDRKLTPYKICLEVGVNYANFKDALEGERGFSDTVLRKLAENEHIKYTYEELKAWRLLDENDTSTLAQAIQKLPIEEQVDCIIAIAKLWPQNIQAQLVKDLKKSEKQQ